MALIRIKTPVSGADFAWRPGEVVDLADTEAAKWADGVRAEYVDSEEAQAPPEVEEEQLAPPAGDDEEPVTPPDGDELTPPDEPPVDPPDSDPPAGNATRDEWAAYVVNVLKVDPAQIEGMGRNELRDRYGAPMDTEA